MISYDSGCIELMFSHEDGCSKQVISHKSGCSEQVVIYDIGCIELMVNQNVSVRISWPFTNASLTDMNDGIRVNVFDFVVFLRLYEPFI